MQCHPSSANQCGKSPQCNRCGAISIRTTLLSCARLCYVAVRTDTRTQWKWRRRKATTGGDELAGPAPQHFSLERKKEARIART
eukprot:4359416-Pyramimonas_sp.AAC.1